MMKARKVALWGTAAFASVLIIGALALVWLTDPAQLKKLAVNHVRSAYSRELVVDKLELSFTPFPGVHATGITVSNPAWAQDRTFFQAKDLIAQIALLPLLRGHVVAEDFSVDGFQVNLERNPDGRTTWGPDPSPATDRTTPAKTKTAVGALSLKNGTIVIREHDPAKPTWQVHDVRLETRPGLRDVGLDFAMTRNEQTIRVQGKFDDLSQIGVKDAVSGGNVRAQVGAATLAVSGQLPLDLSLQRFKLNATIEADSLRETFAFMGMTRRPLTALKASALLEADAGTINVTDLQFQFGKLHVDGDARITRREDRHIFDARVNADRIDWVQVLLDAGFPALPPRAAGELFYDNPLAWNAIAATPNLQGKLRVKLGSLKMRSGMEVSDATAEIDVADGRLQIKTFSANALGGVASGSAMLDGAAQSAQVDLRLKDAALGTWMTQTHKKTNLVGGRMQLHATVTASGGSMKKLAASLSGPVTIEVGSAIVHSQKLSDAETLLNGLAPFFTAKGNDRVDLACISARLPFKQGIATGENIIGVRSDASQLLASGTVDFRRQSLDLHGPVKARAGISLGVSTFASDIRISGKVAAPVVGFDKAGAPGVIARIAAAIVTGGASIIGTTLWDGAQSAPNPCQVVLASSTSQGKTKRQKQRKK